MIDLGATDRRFWDKVKIGKGDECWPWQGVKERKGYGHFFVKGHHTILAHRIAWELVYGERPTLHVLHRCDVPECVRPSHLWLGTDKDNAADRDVKGRNGQAHLTHCKHGHEFTPENTRPHYENQKWRTCKECSRINLRASRARRRAK